VTGSDARDCKRNGKWHVGGITVRTETDFAARENVHPLERGISARFPRPPDAQWGLSGVDVATAPATVTVAAMDAVAADKPIESLLNRFHGVNGFDKDPNLNHVARFPIVGGMSKARCNDDPLRVLVEDEAVAQREPPSAMGTMERSNLVGTGFPSP
jgi:hypothetical protein